MSERWTAAEVSAKVDHEGGIYSALYYGITHKMVPEDIAEEWKELEAMFHDFRRKWESIQDRLPEPWEVDDDY